MKSLKKRDSRKKTFSILHILRKGFTYFLIYYYFFFSSVVCAGTHPRVWVQEPLGIEEQRGPSAQPKFSSLEEEKVSEVISQSSSASKGFLGRLKDVVESTLSTINHTAKEAIYQKIDTFTEWADEGLKDVVPLLLAKTPQEAAFDKDFWHANFIATIEELQENSLPTPEDISYLEDIQSQVGHKLLSPYQYEMGLRELEASWPHQNLESIRTHFQTTLKDYPALLEEAWQSDLLTTLRAIHQSSTNPSELKGLLTYYRSLINPLDYKNTLVSLRSLLRSKKAVFAPHPHKEVISLLNEAIDKSNKQERYDLKVKRALFNNQASELPFFKEEVHSQGIWADVEEDFSLNNISSPSHSPKSLSSQLIHKLAFTLKKGTNFILQHPFQAATIILAGQVAAAAAMKAFSTPQPQPQPPEPKDSDENADNTKAVLSLITESKEDLPVHDYGKRAIGDDFQINQNTSLAQQFPSVASLANGNAFVVWAGTQTGNYDIYGRVFFANGTALSNEFGINKNITYNQHKPSVAGLMDGNAFVAWQGDQVGNNDIYGCVFFANGTVLSNEFGINQNTTSYHYKPSVAGLMDGNAFVVWAGTQTGDTNIYGRIFYPNGTALTDEFNINQNATIAQSPPSIPSITSLNNDNVFISWQVSGYNIYGRIFTFNGTALTDEFIINQNTTFYQSTAPVMNLANGNIFVVWNGNGDQPGGGITDIYGRVLAPNGTALTNDFSINQVKYFDQYNSSISSLVYSNILVLWEGNQNGFTDIYGRVVSLNGTVLGNEFTINQVTAGDQEYPKAKYLSNGNTFVTWYGNQAGNYDIYGRIFTPDFFNFLIGVPSTTGSLGTTISPSTGSLPTTASMTTNAATTQLVTSNNLVTTLLGTTQNPTGIVSTGSFTSRIISTELLTSGNPTTESAIPSSLSENSSNKDQGGSISIPVIAGVAGGVGGVACLTAGGFAAWRYFKHKKDSQERPASLELERLSSDPFAAVMKQGIESLSAETIDGAFGGHFAKYKETNKKLYQLIEEQTGKKVLTPDLSIGRGAYGELTVVRNINTGEFVADKTVTGTKQIEESLNEGRIQDALIKANVPNVVPLLDYVRQVDHQGVEVLHQIMPLAVWNGEELKVKRFLLEDQPLKVRLLHHMAKKLLEGVSYMHSAGYYHLDIKPTNFLVMQDMTVYLADFGRTKKIEAPDQAKEDLLGDRRYFSPNLYSYIRHRWKEKGAEIEVDEASPTFSAEVADSWALGVTLLEIELNQLPFDNHDFNTKVERWRKENFQNMVASLPSLQNPSSMSVLSVVKKLLVVDPKKSSPLAQVLKDSLFKQKTKEISQEEGKQIFKRLNAFLPKEIKESVQPNPNLIVYIAGQENKKSENYTYNNYTEAQPKDRDENYNYNKSHKIPQPDKVGSTYVETSSR